jgi:glutathione S-transferase
MSASTTKARDARRRRQMQLVIGNKNYSSWSMRPWVLMTHFGLPFEEVKLRFDGFEAGSEFKRRIGALNPAGRVPVLVDGDLAVWDTLAIAEYLAEKFPGQALWPRDARQRARARSVSAEMHSGFGALRNHFAMNIEASMPEVGARVLAAEPEVRADVERIVALWESALRESGGPCLFGEFSIADAFFAPVVMRFTTYALPTPPAATAYMERMRANPAVAAWIRDALDEKDFRQFEEPYRTSR